MGDELWIYFAGKNTGQFSYTDPAASEPLSGIGRAVMRLDGFVSADAEYTGGEIVTPLIRFEGKTLELNLDTSGGGTVKVELLDENNKPIAGYSKDQATTLRGNSVRMPVTWGETVFFLIPGEMFCRVTGWMRNNRWVILKLNPGTLYGQAERPKKQDAA